MTVLRGVNLDNGLERLSQKIDTTKVFDIIYVMLGVNNLSRLNADGRVSPVYSDIPTLVEMMVTKFELFKYQIKEMSRNIVLCQLIGINLFIYNKGGPTFKTEQSIINEAMPILAHSLNLINSEDQLVSPWLTKIIYFRTNQKLYNTYGKLRDGLHYSDLTKKTVAKRTLEAILKFLG